MIQQQILKKFNKILKRLMPGDRLITTFIIWLMATVLLSIYWLIFVGPRDSLYWGIIYVLFFYIALDLRMDAINDKVRFIPILNQLLAADRSEITLTVNDEEEGEKIHKLLITNESVKFDIERIARQAEKVCKKCPYYKKEVTEDE